MYRKLEFDIVLKQISEKAQLVQSCANLLHWQHSTDQTTIKTMLEQTDELTRLFNAYSVFSVGGISDLEAVLAKVQQKEVLTGQELNIILSLEERILDLDKYAQDISLAEYPYLETMLGQLNFNQPLAEAINMKIDPSGLLFDDASTNLQRINKEIVKTNQQLNDYLQAFIKKHSSQLQEGLVTFRNQRAVVPVKAESKKAIKGVIHDESGSGQTVYIEPSQVVEYNNQLQTLEYEKKAEIEIILRELTNQVVDVLEQLQGEFTTMIELDIVKAKALYTMQIDGIIPQISNDDKLVIKQGRHPLIKQPVPNDFYLADNDTHYQTVIISGANTGGKTVTLKMLGLFVLMMQSGIGISAQAPTTLPIYEKIFVDIGDEQSIVDSLSTFSAHVHNLAKITQQASSNSLVLLDELGSGTDPRQGENLALAILEYLHNKKASVVATTHYSKLKAYALTTDYVRSASVLFDEVNNKPQYQLVFDSYASSNALAIAQDLGLPKEIIEQADRYYRDDLDTNDELMLKLQDEQVKTKALQEELEQKKSEYASKVQTAEQAIVEAEAKANQLIWQAQEEANELVAQTRATAETVIQKLKDEDKFVNHRVNEIKADLDDLYVEEEDTSDDEKREFKENDLVELTKIKRQGTVKRKIGKNMYEVVVGNVTTKVKQKEMRYLGTAEVSKPVKERKLAKPQVSAELNLIGLRVDEALVQLDRYLDGVVVAGLPQVRIVHGFGTGALRKAVHERLKKNKHVQSYAFAEYNEGGQGATIVKMK